MKQVARCAALGIMLSLAGTAEADRMEFNNGDRLTGTLVSLVDGRMKFRSELAGEVEFDAAEIRTFETDEEIAIHTSDGNVIEDRAVADDEGRFRIAGGTGTLDPHLVALTDTVAINPPGDEPPGLSGSLLAGAEFQRGNSIKDSARVELKTRYERERDNVYFQGSYEGERTENTSTGERTSVDRNLYGLLRYERFFRERVFWFTTAEGERNGPSDLDLRFIGGGGLGYRWFDREDLKFSTRAGLTWTSENFSTGNDEGFLAGLVSWSFERRLAPTVRLFQNGEWLPSLEEFNKRQLWRITTGLRSDLTGGFYLEAKMLWELNTEPASDAERVDIDYIFGLGYRF